MWEKIAKAPLDGTLILGYDPQDEGYFSVMKYEKLWNQGWISADYDAIKFNPTHWMPLPERPLTDEEENLRWAYPLIL